MRPTYCTEIDEEYYRACEKLDEEPELKLLKEMAEAGANGLGPRALPITVLANLSERNSHSTLIRKAGKNSVRIHRYSHALYLLGVKEPNPKDVKLKEKIAEVKEKFGMNAKSA